MGRDEFIACAGNEFEFCVDSWVEVGSGLKDVMEIIAGSVILSAAYEFAKARGETYVMAFIEGVAIAEGIAAAEVIAAIAAALAAGIAIGTIIWVLGNCVGTLV